jgi:diguanylate cyclase (GGDEF)-like protein
MSSRAGLATGLFRRRMAWAERLRPAGSIVALVAIWALGLAAIGAVFALQQRLDSRRQAQVVNAELRQEMSDLSSLAFSSDQGLTRAQVQVQLDAAERQIGVDATELGRLSDDPLDAPAVMAQAHRMFAVLDRVNALASSGHGDSAGVLMGTAGSRGGAEFELARIFTHLSKEFDGEAAQARASAELGSLLAIVAVLLAFSLALLRAARLARQRQREALTDPLTGLANRRRLYADQKELLRRSLAPGETMALGMFDLNGFKNYNDTFGHPVGDALLARLGHKLEAAVAGTGTAYRMGGDEFCVIASGRDAEQVLLDAQAALSEADGRVGITCSVGTVVVVPDQTTLEQALRNADQRLYNNKRSARTREHGDGDDALLRVLVEDSDSLASHVSNVSRLAEAVARRLGLSEDEITLTKLTAQLHDIGKTGIPSAILDKPGPLDDQEWDFMKRHTIIGERILAAAPALARIAPLVRSTHERADGTGYPDGLRADEIPLNSRIVAVVDAYDAMTGNRPYSRPFTPQQALDELRRCAGSQFDADVTGAFIAVFEDATEHAAGDDPADSARRAA